MPSFLLPQNVARADLISKVSRFLALLSPDKSWEVEVKEAKQTRSTDQNSLLWALYDQILTTGGEAMGGWTRDDLHEFFLENHFGTATKNYGGKSVDVPRRRSSRLSKQEFSDFVDSIVRFMASQGIFLEMPGDLR